MVAKVAKIFIYPVKALDGIERDRATVISPGTLELDRRWGMFDEKGKYVNGKRYSKVHQLRCEYNLDSETITLFSQGETSGIELSLRDDTENINQWLSDYFQTPVFLKENLEGGFPDDTEAYGPTIISTATLERVASWFSGLSVDNVRSRLRANLEISGVPAFWEDQLFGEAGEVVKFKIGSVSFQGINPCQRCVVPTRDPDTGETYPEFQKIFTANRQATLPSWTTRERFNHYYRLSINTRISPPETGKVIKIGDEVTINHQ